MACAANFVMSDAYSGCTASSSDKGSEMDDQVWENRQVAFRKSSFPRQFDDVFSIHDSSPSGLVRSEVI
jgi:hypothetical protein